MWWRFKELLGVISIGSEEIIRQKGIFWIICLTVPLLCWICVLKHFASSYLAGLGTPLFSVRYITFFSIKKKNVTFFCILFSKNVTFFCKERKRTERTLCSFAKNGKERENVQFFCKKTREWSILFLYIYRNIYR